MGNEVVQYVMNPGDHLQITGISVWAVPAYTVVRKAHKKTAGHLDYTINMGGTCIYHAGDRGSAEINSYSPVGENPT